MWKCLSRIDFIVKYNPTSTIAYINYLVNPEKDDILNGMWKKKEKKVTFSDLFIAP